MRFCLKHSVLVLGLLWVISCNSSPTSIYLGKFNVTFTNKFIEGKSLLLIHSEDGHTIFHKQEIEADGIYAIDEDLEHPFYVTIAAPASDSRTSDFDREMITIQTVAITKPIKNYTFMGAQHEEYGQVIFNHILRDYSYGEINLSTGERDHVAYYGRNQPFLTSIRQLRYDRVIFASSMAFTRSQKSGILGWTEQEWVATDTIPTFTLYHTIPLSNTNVEANNPVESVKLTGLFRDLTGRYKLFSSDSKDKSLLLYPQEHPFDFLETEVMTRYQNGYLTYSKIGNNIFQNIEFKPFSIIVKTLNLPVEFEIFDIDGYADSFCYRREGADFKWDLFTQPTIGIKKLPQIGNAIHSAFPNINLSSELIGQFRIEDFDTIDGYEEFIGHALGPNGIHHDRYHEKKVFYR